MKLCASVAVLAARYIVFVLGRRTPFRNETDAERSLREDVPMLEFMLIAQCKYCDELLFSDPVGMIDIQNLKWSV